MNKNLEKTKSLNNRVNEYGIFLKAINHSIALGNTTDIVDITNKQTSLSICKSLGIKFGFNYFLNSEVKTDKNILLNLKI